MQQAQTVFKPVFPTQPYNLTASLNVQQQKAEQCSLERFKAALADLFIRGTELRSDESAVQTKATVALSKILGIAQDIYGKASISEKEELMAHLRQRCRADGLKKIDKRTTIFHLLSRQFRGSDRKQASADAKILDRADKEKQTEKTFCDWVKELGGLNNIKNYNPTSVDRDGSRTVRPKKENAPFRKWQRVASISENVPDALKELAIGVEYTIVRHSDGRVDIMAYGEVKDSDQKPQQSQVITKSSE